MKLRDKYDVEIPPYLAQEVSLRSQGQVIDWGHSYLKASDVYDKTKGEGSVIFILDTAGEFTHPDLVNQTIPELDMNFSNSPSRADVHGHGTHCAGIAAATDNGIGVIGIAPKASLVACKVLNDKGQGSFSQIAKAIRYVADLPPHSYDYKKRII